MTRLGDTILAAAVTPLASSATDHNLVTYKRGNAESIARGSAAKGAKVIRWSSDGRSGQGPRFVARVIDA
ncbi:hypothetical protein SAMN04488564_101985 [Lentzea waywayandensis]|uniref:Uncharacterized protein n=1 Tax=Lentzea waywayandensis TaxID=84724 RepID=A0A1I6D3E0_9PSEU|nr:hypothetical protein [Lentzea waywayandensis]SFQ99989.1 hypothetical protein SAMN04488564_101985 [Lentzea waywayandensis]